MIVWLSLQNSFDVFYTLSVLSVLFEVFSIFVDSEPKTDVISDVVMSSVANAATNGWVDKSSHSDVVYVKLNQMNGLVTQTTCDDNRQQLVFKRLFSALFYAISSFLIIVINKIVLTNYKFVSLYSLIN